MTIGFSMRLIPRQEQKPKLELKQMQIAKFFYRKFPDSVSVYKPTNSGRKILISNFPRSKDPSVERDVYAAIAKHYDKDHKKIDKSINLEEKHNALEEMTGCKLKPINFRGYAPLQSVLNQYPSLEWYHGFLEAALGGIHLRIEELPTYNKASKEELAKRIKKVSLKMPEIRKDLAYELNKSIVTQ